MIRFLNMLIQRGGRSRRSKAGSQQWMTAEILESRELLTVFVADDVPKEILDRTTVTSTLTIPESTESVVDINVKLNLTHTRDYDLRVYLISPTGTRVTLAQYVGYYGQNFVDTVFDDEASSPIYYGSAPFTGSFRPYSSLSTLRGTPISGEWKLEVSDVASRNTGTLDSWSLDISTAGSVMLSAGNVAPDPRNVPVTSTDVTFSRPVVASTFTRENLTLTRNRVEVPLDNTVTVTQVDDTPVYRIDGLESFTDVRGEYKLSISTVGMESSDGGPLYGAKPEVWTFQSSQLLDIVDIRPAVRNVPVQTIDTVFSLPLNLSTLTYENLKLRRNGDLVRLDETVTIARIGQTNKYRISGMEPFTTARGNYQLEVNSSGIKDDQGYGAGGGVATAAWTLTGPQVVDIINVSPDPRNTGVGAVRVKFLFPIDQTTFDINDMELLRYDETIELDDTITITADDADETNTTYLIRGLAPFTQRRGNYELRVSGSGVKDLYGHNGFGSATDTWSLTGPRVLSVSSALPYYRNTQTDTVEVAFRFTPTAESFDYQDLTLYFNSTLVELDSSVTIAQIDGTTKYLISGLGAFTNKIGSYRLLVNGAEVRDEVGRPGEGTAYAYWSYTRSGINYLYGTSSSLRSKPISSVGAVSYYAPELDTFDFNDVTLTLNGDVISLDERVVVSQTSTQDSNYYATYLISGLEDFNTEPGNYVLTVNNAGLADANGNAGSGSEYYRWTIDKTPAVVTDVVDVANDRRFGRDIALPSIQVVVSPDMTSSSFTTADLTLRLDGGPDLIDQNVIIRRIAGNKFEISNLAKLTRASGKYVFTVHGSFTDYAGNTSYSSASANWLALDQPAIQRVGTVAFYPEDSPPMQIIGNPAVTDADSENFRAGSLTVSIIRGLAENDKLSILSRLRAFGYVSVLRDQVRYGTLTIGTFSGGEGEPLVISLNSNATPAAVAALIRCVAFSSPGDHLTTSKRTIQFELNDGSGAIRTVKKFVHIQPVDDASTLEASDTMDYTLNGDAASVIPWVVVEDSDSSLFTNHILRFIVSSGRDGSEKFRLGDDFTLNGRNVLLDGTVIGFLHRDGTDTTGLVLRFNQNATLAIVRQTLRSVTFSTEDSTSSATRGISVTLQGRQGALSEVLNVDVNIL